MPLECAGRAPEVNAVTIGDGELAAELLDAQGQPLPGFGRADCLAFRGDEQRARLAWRGGSTCTAKWVSVRFYLRRVRLFGFAFA